MKSQAMSKKVVVATALGSGVALALAGCGSSSSSSTSESPTAAATSAAPAPAPAAGVPAPPAGSTLISGPTATANGGTYNDYKSSQTPTAVTGYYSTALKDEGFTITNSGSGGGGWGQYGGSGSQVGGNNGTLFVEVNAGGSKQGATFFEVCSGPSQAAVNSCQSGNHGQSQSS